MATRVTQGMLLSGIALVGQMAGMALAKGSTGIASMVHIALGFGGTIYVAVHALLVHPRRAVAPRALAVSLWTGYGGTLALMPLV